MRTYKQINGSITAIITAAEKMQTRIQDTAIEALQHCQAYGDTSLIKRLCTQLPAGQRAKALGVWVGKYFPVTVKGGEWKLKQGWDKNPDMWRFDEAIADPYWTPAEDKMFNVDLGKMSFDAIVKSALASNLNRLERAKEKVFHGEADPSLTIDDLDAQIEALKSQASEQGFGAYVN